MTSADQPSGLQQEIDVRRDELSRADQSDTALVHRIKQEIKLLEQVGLLIDNGDVDAAVAMLANRPPTAVDAIGNRYGE
jgi:hypothetical protein